MVHHAKPELMTGPALNAVMSELIAYESIFHQPERGTTRDEFERITALEFWEVGASGRIYSRNFVLDLLEQRYADPETERLVASDFQCRRLSTDVFLLTYNLLQQGLRKTCRSSICGRSVEGWQILFHQGTIVEGETF